MWKQVKETKMKTEKRAKIVNYDELSQDELEEIANEEEDFPPIKSYSTLVRLKR